MKIYTQIKINNSWFAGFFEGDGTAYEMYSKNQKGLIYYKPVIQLFQSNKDILKLITTLVSGRVYLDNSSKSRKKNAYRIIWQSKKASKPILDLLRREYLSKSRQNRIIPMLEKINLKPRFKKEINWSWLRGFFVAEGCVYRNRQIIFSQTNQEILNIIELFLIKRKINCRRNKKDIRIHNKKDYNYLIKKLCLL